MAEDTANGTYSGLDLSLMMHILYLSAFIWVLDLCLAIPLPTNPTTGLNNDNISTNNLKQFANIEPSTTKRNSHLQDNTELDTQGDVVSSGSGLSETSPGNESEMKLQALIDLVKSVPWKRLNLPDSMKLDLNRTSNSANVIHPTVSTRPARERRSSGFITVNVNCSEHPDLCQQAIAWLQQHDKPVPASLSHWQG